MGTSPSTREQPGVYLTLGKPGALSQFESQVFPNPHQIRPDFLTPILMSAEHQLTTRMSSDALVFNPKRAPGPKFNLAGGLKPL